MGSGDDVSRDAEWNKEHWKLSQVVSYQVLEKERENRPRPFHKDYRHYKYFGRGPTPLSPNEAFTLVSPNCRVMQLAHMQTGLRATAAMLHSTRNQVPWRWCRIRWARGQD